MGYGNKSLNDWRDDSHRIAKEHGFKDASIAEDFALMHSEISEALEDFREGKGVTEVWYEEKVPVCDQEGKPIVVDGKPLMTVAKHSKMSAPTEKPCGLCQGRGSFMAAVADRNPDSPCPACNGTGKKPEFYKPCGIPSEMADVIIRVLHFAGKHGIDIEQAVREKTLYNETRPYKHGNKKI